MEAATGTPQVRSERVRSGHPDEYERMLARWYMAWHGADAVFILFGTLGNLSRYRRPRLALALAALGLGQNVWSTWTIHRASRVGSGVAWTDTFTAALLNVAAAPAAHPEDADHWRNWTQSHLDYHSEIVGVGLRSWPARTLAVAVMCAATALSQHLRGRPGTDAVGVASTLVAKAFVMHGFTDVTRHLARRLVTADEDAVAESARMSGERTRAAHHRASNRRALAALRRIAGGDPADPAIRAATAQDAAGLRWVLTGRDGCAVEAALAEVVESAACSGISVEVAVGDVASVPGPTARELAAEVACVLSDLPPGTTRLVLHADTAGRVARAELRSPGPPAGPPILEEVSVAW